MDKLIEEILKDKENIIKLLSNPDTLQLVKRILTAAAPASPYIALALIAIEIIESTQKVVAK